MTLNVTRAATCRDSHSYVILESSYLLLFMSDLISKEIILSFQIENLLGPVLLSKFTQRLDCLLILSLHVLLVFLSRFEILVDDFLSQIELSHNLRSLGGIYFKLVYSFLLILN